MRNTAQIRHHLQKAIGRTLAPSPNTESHPCLARAEDRITRTPIHEAQADVTHRDYVGLTQAVEVIEAVPGDEPSPVLC